MSALTAGKLHLNKVAKKQQSVCMVGKSPAPRQKTRLII